MANDSVQLTLGRIAYLRLNRPHVRNAVNVAMWSELTEACRLLERTPEVRVLVLSGNGQNFCAGADISEFEAVYASAETAEKYISNYRAVEDAIRGLSMAVIAEISGACIGGGLGLALSADFRFADPTVRMGITASKLGLAYSAEDTARVIEKIGAVKTKDMLFSARMIDADEALDWGLIDRLVPARDLSTTVSTYASVLADRSPASLSASKKIVDALTAPTPELCDRLKPIYSRLFHEADFVEGRTAFVEKRDPRFR